MLKFLILIFTISLFPSASLAEHWIVGAWDCRSWGAIRIFEEGYAIDLNPDGELQNLGVWQNHNKNSVIIVWLDSNLIEIIEKRSNNRFYRQASYGFGIATEVEETKKLIKENKGAN